MVSISDKVVSVLDRLAAGSGGAWGVPERGTDQSVLQWADEAKPAPHLLWPAVAEALGIPFVQDLTQYQPAGPFVEQVPIGFARQHGVMGLSEDGQGQMIVAIGSLKAWSQLDVLGRYLGCALKPVLAPADQIAAAINQAYQQKNSQAQEVIEKLDRGDVLDEVERLQDQEDLLDVASRAPVIKLVNMILFEAVKLLASDVHVQPYETKLTVRMRIDGVLYDMFDLPKAVQEEVLSRVKVMGRMNIAEKRLAQDGRTTVQVGDRVIDLRIASIPTSFGERIVIRLLDKTATLFSLDEVGMDPGCLEQFRWLAGSEHGLVLVTGPTGSGKSTTLYATLSEINSRERNILTLEDPIEYQLAGVSQTQVSEKKGMTFASGLRSVLRQDPDVIMVGEIRDRETAVMAIQSALTGHLVFSTLHTNDAASAVTRLLDLGIEPYLVASSVIGVMAQRLVRQVCAGCAQLYVPLAGELEKIGVDPDRVVDLGTMRQGAGCEACRNSGYRGRVGVFELLVVSDAICQQIQSRATASQIKATAIDEGMKTLAQDSAAKMLKGVTTTHEVARVITRTVS